MIEIKRDKVDLPLVQNKENFVFTRVHVYKPTDKSKFRTAQNFQNSDI